MSEPEYLTRRRFIAALAASVVAVGLPLPIGMSPKVVEANVLTLRLVSGQAVGGLIGSYLFDAPVSVLGPRLI